MCALFLVERRGRLAGGPAVRRRRAHRGAVDRPRDLRLRRARRAGSLIGHFSGIWPGSFALAVLMLPIVIRASEAAMRAVPRDLWEAGLALGVRRSRVVRSVVLRGALPGLVTGNLLAVARAVGETAPLLFTILGASPLVTNPLQPMGALPLTIYSNANQPFPDRPADRVGNRLRPSRPGAGAEHRGPARVGPPQPPGPMKIETAVDDSTDQELSEHGMTIELTASSEPDVGDAARTSRPRRDRTPRRARARRCRCAA